MSRIVVIGATGHVGSYLVPRLVRAGHEVVAPSRGEREPYVPAPEWSAVQSGSMAPPRECPSPRTSRALEALRDSVRRLATAGELDLSGERL